MRNKLDRDSFTLPQWYSRCVCADMFSTISRSYYDLLVGPAIESRTEIIGMPYENDVHYGAVSRESRTHVSAQALGVAKTPVIM
jgi:hypothetical protein